MGLENCFAAMQAPQFGLSLNSGNAGSAAYGTKSPKNKTAKTKENPFLSTLRGGLGNTPAGKLSADVVQLNLHKEALRQKTVSVYGSARTKPGDGYYEHARNVGEALAKAGLNVVTGGGPGAMRAVAEGAIRFPVNVMGMAMSFIGEEHSTDVHRVMRHFNNFFDRLDNFESEAALSAAVPGGIGSLMELTNIATKLDTNSTPYSLQKQIVLFDKNNVFRDFVKHIDENFVQKGFISPRVLTMLKVVGEDEIEKGVALLKANKEFTQASGE